MTLDRHTPCAACPIQVRDLFAQVQVLLAQLELLRGSGIRARDVVPSVEEAMAGVSVALQHLAPFVEGHLENQEHGLSVDLAAARHPVRPGALVLERVLPFPGPEDVS